MASKRLCLQFFVLIWYLMRFRYTFGANDDSKKLIEKFAWKTIEYAWETDHDANMVERNYTYNNYKPEHNVPFSIDVSNDRLFVSIPRLKSGVIASLSYVNLANVQNGTNPKFIPYPSWNKSFITIDSTNTTNQTQPATSAANGTGAAAPAPITSTPAATKKIDNLEAIISGFQIRVDKCNNLWVLDSGIVDILDNPRPIKPPALVIFNLNSNELIGRVPFPANVFQENAIYVNMIVDDSSCNDLYAYVADFSNYGIIVYSRNNRLGNKFWRVKHNFFHFDPWSGKFKAGGRDFILNYGVFGMALGKKSTNGHRTVYFHPLSSTHEFSVQNYVLKNETRATSTDSYYDYVVLGTRDSNGQSTFEFFDDESNVLFYININKNSIACWNANKTYAQSTHGNVNLPASSSVFLSDIKIDQNGALWILSNPLLALLSDKTYQLKSDQTNIQVWTGKASEVIKGTPCDPNPPDTQKKQ